MNKILKTLLALIALTCVCALPARANVIVNATEVGGDVVFAGGGTFNLAGLSFLGIGGEYVFIQANIPAAFFGADPVTPVVIDVYGNIASPGPFGPGSTFFADLGSGDRFGVLGPLLGVPFGYSSGSLLSASNTYSGMTFASMGITPGTYTWTWGSGVNADSFTLNIGAPAVPESGSTAFSMLLALGALALLGRSGQWKRAR